MKKFGLVFSTVLALTLAGCVSAGGGPRIPVLSWVADLVTHRKEGALKKADTELTAKKDEQLRAAQREASKTRRTAALLPPSRPAQLVQRFSANTDDLIAESIGPLPSFETDRIDATVAALTSEDATIREGGEHEQQRDERQNADRSQAIVALTQQLEEIKTEKAEVDRQNASLASELLAARYWKWAGIAGTVLMTAASVAFKYDLMGLRKGVADSIARLQTNHGAGAADIARQSIDAFTREGQQNVIGRRVFTLLQNSASTPPPSVT